MPFAPGEPVPWFVTRTASNPSYHFDTVAGRYVVLCFFGSSAHPACQQILGDIEAHADRFDSENVCFFGVTIDAQDEQTGRLRDRMPGIRYFFDTDRSVSQLYRVAQPVQTPSGIQFAFQPHTFVLDPRLRVLKVFPFEQPVDQHVFRLLTFLDTLPPIGPRVPAAVQAPVLVVPRVLEPEFCRTLIDLYDRHGGQESGFMKEQDGKTVQAQDHRHKKRRDHLIEDPALRRAIFERLRSRLFPEIRKAFQFEVTHIERYIVSCYDSETGGYFRAHRDNTTKGTAHRRFACTLNLNTGEYEGGDLRFPEFGPQTYQAPLGGTVVFSCSLLHEALPVTRGKRYACLPFFYDAEGARIREANRVHLAEQGKEAE